MVKCTRNGYLRRTPRSNDSAFVNIAASTSTNRSYKTRKTGDGTAESSPEGVRPEPRRRGGARPEPARRRASPAASRGRRGPRRRSAAPPAPDRRIGGRVGGRSCACARVEARPSAPPGCRETGSASGPPVRGPQPGEGLRKSGRARWLLEHSPRNHPSARRSRRRVAMRGRPALPHGWLVQGCETAPLRPAPPMQARRLPPQARDARRGRSRYAAELVRPIPPPRCSPPRLSSGG